MSIPRNWMRIEANNEFCFWLPPALVASDKLSHDSYVRRWESKDVVVHFDYGRFSDPLTLYSRKNSYEAATERIGGYTTTIVSFQRDDGSRFTAAHFPDLGSDQFGRTVKLTLAVDTHPKVPEDVPLKIVRSITFC